MILSAVGGGVAASASYMGVEGSPTASFITHSKITVLDTVLVATVKVRITLSEMTTV